jgi:hypothetical protein
MYTKPEVIFSFWFLPSSSHFERIGEAVDLFLRPVDQRSRQASIFLRSALYRPPREKPLFLPEQPWHKLL